MTARLFVLEIGRALHALGSPAYRVEDAMDACCRRFGLHGHFFATPTGIFAAIGPVGQRAETELLRVLPGKQDLGRLAELYEVRDEVMAGTMDPAHGTERARAIAAAHPTGGDRLVVPAQGLASAAACTFLGGGALEILVAFAVGVLLGAFAWLVRHRPALERVFEPAACALAALAVHVGAALVGPLNISVATIGAIIVLLPGLMFTTALAELSMRHLAAGSARLLGAVAVLLTMAVGVGLGDRVGELICGDGVVVEPLAVHVGWQWAALIAAGFGFAALLRASRAQLPWVLLAVLIGFGGARLGALWFERELGAFVGAVCVAVAANLYSRWQRRPAATMRTPGLLLLVPGSLGFRGLTTALQQDFTGGAQLAFQMLLVGAAIVAGLLVAGVVVPPPLDVEPDSARQTTPA